VCFIDAFLRERELFERARLESCVMFSDSRYSRDALQRSSARVGIILLSDSTPLLQNLRGVSRNCESHVSA